MNLYEINQELEQAFFDAVDQETGEINEEAMEKFNALQMEQDEKIENIALFIKNLKAEAEALKVEKMSFQKRQQQAEKKAEYLAKYLADFLGGEKFKTNRVSISYRKSESVKVTDLWSVPDDYLTFAEPTVDKAAVKKALKEGVEISGVEIVTSNSMQIR